MKRLLWLIAAAGLACATTLCSAQEDVNAAHDVGDSSPAISNSASIVLHDRFPRYQIATGDVIDLNFEFTPEYNQTLTVQPDGFVALKGPGDIHVSGMTVPQLKASVTSAYGAILHDPKVEIVLKDFNRPYFVVNGQVGRPGKYELRGDLTLMDGVAVAGGLLDSSKHSQVVLFRRVSDQWSEARLINVKEMLNSRNLNEDMHLRPGDMIYVPQNRISKLKHLFPNTGLGMTMSPANFP